MLKSKKDEKKYKKVKKERNIRKKILKEWILKIVKMKVIIVRCRETLITGI